MWRYRSWCSSAAAVALAAASAHGAETFNYTENFNALPSGATPPGWSSVNGPNNPGLAAVVMDADPASFGTPCNDGTATPAGCGSLGVLQDYTVPWSGGKRFTLSHAANFYLNNDGWAAAAWYGAAGGTHTGTYPMNLQTNRLKISFDMIVRTGTDRCGGGVPGATPADGGVFAVVPVQNLASDLTRIGTGGGGMGWGGLPGFAVEFDIYDNGAANDPPGGDAANHIGLDVFLRWAGGDQVPSLVTHLDAAVPEPLPRFVQTGDNNQPLHVTIYYNDPAEGGIGVVRVYMKVDPATYPGSGGTGSAISFGMSSPHPDGWKVLEACVGAWPTSGAIFGLTASTGGCDSVYQIDNIVASTDDSISGTVCEVTGLPPFRTDNYPDPNTPTVTELNSAGAQPYDAGKLSNPGWDATTYRTFAGDLAGLKASLPFAQANGWVFGSTTGEPSINFNDDGVNTGNANGDRRFPGLPVGGNDNVGAVFKGWIAFPPDDGSNPYPRRYSLAVNSDDGFEWIIGTGSTNQVVSMFATGRGNGTGLDAGTFIDLQVPAPGVYPTQIIWFEGGGGMNIEVYRRFPTDSLLLIPPIQLLGVDQGPYSDQPRIYGLYDGQPAPDLISTYTPLAPTGITLSPSQKVAGTASGDQVFRTKTVRPSYPGIDQSAARDDAGDFTTLKFLDLVNNLAPGSTSATVNFRGVNDGGGAQNEGALPGGSNFPGLPNSQVEQFSFRAEGFAVFEQPGMYILGSDSDDDAWIRIGDQTIFSAGCCPNTQFNLFVTEAGTYPIRVELREGGGDARIKFYEIAPGVPGNIPVNSAQSRIKVYEAATSGAYAWDPHGMVIEAARKVAEVGQGTEPGWNAILAQVPGIQINGDGDNAAGINNGGLGLATALIENDLVNAGTGFATQAFDSPTAVNYADIGEASGRFSVNEPAPYNIADRSTGEFLKTDSTPMFTAAGNEDFTISVHGYVDIPAPGTYGFGTNGDDGMILWIAGKVANVFPFNTGPADNTPAIVYFEQAGIYDIRCDWFERGGGAEMEVFEYLPDGSTRALINSPESRVTVYRSLSVAPAVDLHNPVRLPLSLKAAPIDRGGESGARIRLVNASFFTGNGDGGVGHEKLRTLLAATELLDSVTGDGPASLSQFGTLVADTVSSVIDFGEGTFPGPVNADDYAMRATGYLALTQGGHIFGIASDDGFTMRMGDRVVGESGSLKGASWVKFYVHAPEDGLYPFTIDWFERGGGNSIRLVELVVNPGPSLVAENVNTGSAAKMYVDVNACPVPFADLDADGDVDQNDFGILQACITLPVNDPGAPQLPQECRCADVESDRDIDSADYAAWFNCVTGPDVPWSQDLTPACDPG